MGKLKQGVTLLAAKDMKASKRFYTEVLGMAVVVDIGANVMLDSGIALQEAGSWATFLLGMAEDAVAFGGRQFEVVFETDEIEAYAARVDAAGAQLVHELREYPWGQRVLRVYDPDGHIIEIGEDMGVVVRRFFEAGCTMEEVMEKTMYPRKVLEGMKKNWEEAKG